ncbi:MAG TPA: 2-oxoacid:acceptor oxidoreductase family protein [Candidatus Methylomirabilis sp.]|jgi:pyruvate ferredoxin oxidoreductase gamma subunit|nr:2-oxoacid:acceptor oxidoreductase family protein [Candidatus Methylomirabilis sp.]
MLEIRWHARAGQGAITAAKVLAEAAMEEGKYIQAMPEYGPERSGAPIRAYNRISTSPIRQRSQVTTPDLVVVVDPSLLETEDLLAGTDAAALLLINTPEDPRVVRERLQVPGRRIFTLDATRIAREEMGKNFPNTPLLGALTRMAAEVGLEGVQQQLRRELGKKVTPAVLESNLRALERGYREVRGEESEGEQS